MSSVGERACVGTNPLRVTSETGRLRHVIIGHADSFVMPEPINRKQRIWHREHPERPTPQSLAPEFAEFRARLEERGVRVEEPVAVAGVPDQLTPRDIGFVVGDSFVISSMATECRREEWRGIARVIDRIPQDRRVRVPADVIVEGGDVVLDRGRLYVGVGERTTPDGAAFLRDVFGGDYDVVPVPLRTLDEGEDVLHLDCAFVPVGEHHALIYPAGFRSIPEPIREEYEWIEVGREEQHALYVNVLSISPRTVLSQRSAVSVNDRLRELDLEVIEVGFAETPKSGGSLRCASLPLYRE